MSEEYLIYKHTSPSNKVYIGITSQTPEKRWHGGANYSGQPYFYNAIRKYGWDNFKHEIIRSGLTEEEAKIAERKLIKRYDSRNREFGYNATPGGDISPMKSMQARAKSSASHKGKAMLPQTRAALLNSRLGISLSEDHKSKISSSISELWKDPEYRKRNVSKHLVRSVEQYSMDGSFVARYISLKEADLSTGVDYRNIQACCKGRKKSAGGFVWKYSSSQANTEVNTETKESVSP